MKKLWITSIFFASALGVGASELKVPSAVPAGAELSVPTSGSGNATVLVVGPGTAIKRDLQLGQPIRINGDDLKNAGRYMIALSNGDSGSFFVIAGPVNSVAFLARPSRVPADTRQVISGTVFLLDKDQNLVLAPQPVKFELTVNGESVSRTETSRGGVAYIKLDSARREGSAQFVASSGPASVRRVVQIAASDPCNLRMHAQPSKNGLLVQTDPIRDCAGNPVPDGTIVTFTSVDANGKSTVDARVKRGTAQAQLPVSNNATISVAAGVVVGNEIHWEGKP